MLSVLQSCEYDMDFSDFGHEPRLFVMGMAGGSDMTVIRLLPAGAIGDSHQDGFSVDGAQVSLKVNGEDVPLSIDDELPYGCYVADIHLLPGDAAEFAASVEGVDPVRAKCVVPGRFPEYEVELKTEKNGWNGNDLNGISTRLKLTVRFDDDPDTKDYYGMQVYRMTETYSYFNILEYEYMKPMDDISSGIYDFPLSGLPLTMHYSPGEGMFSKDYVPMMVVDDGMFADGNGVMEFLTNFNDDTSNRRYMYKVFLYRLSPELYRFARANAIASDNVPILVMMAPPAHCYTNVLGGVGVFGGITRMETDWLPNVK